MENINTMRYLRQQYNITFKELANAVGVSLQRISQIEYRDSDHTDKNLVLIQRAFETVILERKKENAELEMLYNQNRHRLFAPENLEVDNEL